MARKSSKRTDPHRPGAILPSDYRYVFSYNLSTTEGGWPVPSFGINCELDRRSEIDGKIVNGAHDDDGECCQCGLLAAGKTVISGPGKCAVCGAAFIYGDVWQHAPTGEYIHIGHDCAAKYSLLADRSAWQMADRRARAAAIAAASRHSREGKLVRFCEQHPGLREAFDTDHHIIADIRDRLRQYGEISPKQVALVMRLAAEVKNPPPPEQHTPAPTGKQTFRGRVVAVKAYDNAYGTTLRMTVKIETPAGSWLAWGTAPLGCLSESCNHGGLKGCDVEVTATLEAGREPHFAIMKRPRGTVTRFACADSNEFCAGCCDESRRWCPVQKVPSPFDDFEVAS